MDMGDLQQKQDNARNTALLILRWGNRSDCYPRPLI